MSNKLKKQVGVISTLTQMPGGGTWKLNYKLNVNCLKESKDFGVGLFLTKENPKISKLNYNFETYYPTYGFTNQFYGLMVLYTKNQLNVGFYNDYKVTRDEFLFRSKTCKVHLDKNKDISFVVKYND